MKRIVSLVVTLLSFSSVFSETLPVEEIVNIPPAFTDLTGDYYDECPHAQDWCIYYDNVFGVVYHPETDANGNLVENFYSSHDVVKEIIFHPQSQATTIGYMAFCYLAALQSITFPQGITSIDSYAFQGTLNVSTIKVYVTDISAFCNNLVIGQIKYRLNQSVTLIDSEGVEITAFVIPDGVETIGANAFNNCTGLTSVTIPDGVTAIGASAFAGCTGLTSVTIPSSVTSIGSNAFPASTEIWVPKGMKDYYQNLLGSNNKVFEIGTQICTYINIIYALDNDSHTAEAVGVRNNTLTRFLLPAQFTTDGVNYTVTGINGHAFEGCHNMTEMDIPHTVTNIGAYAFSGCSSLTSMNISQSVTTIGDYTFNGCTALTSVTIPEGVTNIGASAFYDCIGLTSVTFPSTLTGIGQDAFNGCTGLTKVIVPDIAVWCNVVFCNYFSNPLVYAHHLYSDDKTEITDLVIPQGVTAIKSYAFTYSTGLASVTIPSSVTNIGNYAFLGCNGLLTVTINSSSVMSRYYMSNIFGKQVENYVIGGNVTSIGSYAFQYCTAMKSVTISPTVTSIGYSAFRGCTSLTTVTFTEGMSSIGDDAFNGCTNLTDIYNLNPRPQTINSNVFTNYGATLYVLESCVSEYQAADVWKQFNIVGVLKGDVNRDHVVDVADFIMLANYLLGNSSNGFCLPVADVSGSANGGGPDGVIDVTDMIGIANIILHGDNSQTAAPTRL